MIIKERQCPPIISSLETLLNRLPLTHPSYQTIFDDLQKRLAGQRGEEKTDAVMKHFSSPTFHTIRDLKFSAFHESIQVDQLHITPYFLLFCEVKHIRGSLFIDEAFGQLTRTSTDATISYPGITQQMSRQEEGLQLLLNNFSIQLPIYKLAVFTHSDVHLHTRDEYIGVKEIICRIEQLTQRIRHLLTTNTVRYLSNEQCLELAHTLARCHIPPSPPDLLTWYSIPKHHIISGVQCRLCQKFEMKRTRKSWKCPHCSYSEISAHEKAFSDFFQLFNTPITNQKAREFLAVDSPRTVRTLLDKMDFIKKGATKERVYFPRE